MSTDILSFFFLSSAVVLAWLPTFLKRTNRKIKQCLFTAGYLGRLDRCHATRPSRTECFRRVSRLEDNGKTDKSSCIRIVTFLLKLSSQWVKYALACVYIDLPIGEMKKKANMSEFIHNLARGRPSARRLLVFYQVSSAMAEENCRKER